MIQQHAVAVYFQMKNGNSGVILYLVDARSIQEAEGLALQTAQQGSNDSSLFRTILLPVPTPPAQTLREVKALSSVGVTVPHFTK